MHVSFALFADAANLSQEGKLNILGVFDAVQVATLPTVHPRAHLVVRLKGTRADVGTHTMTLRWLNPNAEELWSSEGELSVGAPPPGVTDMDLPFIAPLDLPIDRAGIYTMSVTLDDVDAVSVPLHVRGMGQVGGWRGSGGWAGSWSADAVDGRPWPGGLAWPERQAAP